MSNMWDERYAADQFFYGLNPNAFLAAKATTLPPGCRVLCVGDGEGRNGVWLAEQGFDVCTVEPSSAGVQKARALAAEHGVKLDVQRGRMPEHKVPVESFDAVVLVYVHVPSEQRAAFHAAAVRALKPGGVVLLEAFSPAQLGRPSGGPQNVSMLYSAEAVGADFEGLEALQLEECETELDEGPGHHGAAQVVRFVGRKRT